MQKLKVLKGMTAFCFPMKDMLKVSKLSLKMNSILNSWIKKNAEVLDLGCGDGTLLAGLKDT